MKLLVLLVTLGKVAHADGVRHVPPGEAEAGQSIELVAEAPATTATLVAHVRTAGDHEFRAIELVRRDDAKWVAVVPVTVPGLEYFLDAGGQPVFASAEWPHTLAVHLPAETERKGRDLVRNAGHRSRIHVSGDYVDFGSRTVTNMKVVDHYYRVDADFSYHLLAYPLEQLRVGYTRLIGDSHCDTCASTQTGFKVGGWFELGLAPIEGIRFDGRVMMMATSAGFNFGERAEARLGAAEASHVALGVEHMATVGTSGYFRLGWGTVPKLPMAATVEVTNMPAVGQTTGVRLFYDIARDIGSGVKLGLRVGYAARTSSVAGITGGAGATVDF
jgi:hypothetical protein